MSTVKDVLVNQPTSDQKATCKSWPIWRHDPSTFDWTYTDKETCLLVEGRVTVSDSSGSVSFKAGDRVEFPKGLVCNWTIHETVVKHYTFG
jgi:uncharacterized cupin superfamily protein